MSFSLTTLLYLTFATNLVLGGFIWYRHPTRLLNKAYLLLCVSISFWVLTNALYVSFPSVQYEIALVSYGAAALVAVSFLYLCMHISQYWVKYSKTALLIGIPLSTLWAIPGFVSSGVKNGEIVTTPAIIIYAVFVCVYFALGITTLIIGMRHAEHLQKSQLMVMLLGVSGAVAGGLLFNLWYPLQRVYTYTELGPVFSLVFVIASGYAIAKHRLFDVRFALMRIVAYSLSLICVGGLIGIFAASISNLVDLSKFPLTLTIVVVSVVIAVIFAPVKTFFDRVTYKVFYISSYDTQKVIDNLTSQLSRAVDMKQIARKTAMSLREVLSAQCVEILFINEETTEIKSIGMYPVTRVGMFDHELFQILGTLREDYFAVDEATEKTRKLADNLSEKNISVVVKLRSPQGLIGYILVGYKQTATSFSRQDLELLAIVGDELSIALENGSRFQRINEFNVELQQRIEAATGELRTSNKKLKALDESKDEFISMASHQLRTPLTSVKGYLSMVLEGDVGTITDDQRKLLEEAFNSSQRMVYLIGDFLNVSRLQTGKFELEKSNVELTLLINDEIAQLRATAQARNIVVEYQPPESFPLLSVDENKLRQVMMNFIDNAIYYSKPDGGKVTISLTKHVAHISFKVSDNGIGVPKSEQHQLFTKFYRASNAKKARPDGTGIGLFMARKVIIAHGGAILFESTEGKGSTFGFQLPTNTTE